MKQFAKFFLVGLLNFLIDLGILMFLVSVFETNRGVWYSVFKAVSFLIATLNSYFLNRTWTFESREKRFSLFLKVSIVSFLINVATASLIVNVIDPCFGASPKAWAAVGAIAGSATALFSNFFGYKFIVFKEHV